MSRRYAIRCLATLATSAALVGASAAQAAPPTGSTTGAVTGSSASAAAVSGSVSGEVTGSGEPKPVPRGNLVTSRADIDGDGRADTTTFRLVPPRGASSSLCRLSVRTATGQRAHLNFRLGYEMQDASDFWMGMTGIDGHRGNEVVLDLVGGIGDATDIRSYAWRDGRLVLVPAAGSTRRWPNWELMWTDFGAARGYTFSQSGGTRYVTRHDYRQVKGTNRFAGTDTRYRWSGSGWRKVSTTKVTVSRQVADTRTTLRGLTWR